MDRILMQVRPRLKPLAPIRTADRRLRITNSTIVAQVDYAITSATIRGVDVAAFFASDSLHHCTPYVWKPGAAVLTLRNAAD